MLVYTGLLRALQQEDQLAAVLSHEIAHVLARHTVNPLSMCLLVLSYTGVQLRVRPCKGIWTISGSLKGGGLQLWV